MGDINELPEGRSLTYLRAFLVGVCECVRVARGQLTLQWAHRSLVRGTLIPLFLYSVFLSFVHRLVMSVIFFFLSRNNWVILLEEK